MDHVSFHEDFHPYLIVRQSSQHVYEIVGHAVVTDFQLEEADLNTRHRHHYCSGTHIDKVWLLIHPEDFVLFHLLSYQMWDDGAGHDSHIRSLYHALSDSFCRTRFSSFLIDAPNQLDNGRYQGICTDCGGTTGGECKKGEDAGLESSTSR